MAFQAKRQYVRRSSREAVRILSRVGVEYATFEDISAGGLKLWMKRNTIPGEVLKLEFLLPYSGAGRYQDMKIDVIVVRSEKKEERYEVGVKFIELPQGKRLLLETVVDCTSGSF